MTRPPAALLRRREWLLAALATIAGCGGVDSGGTGSSPTFSAGAITGLGSVIVNGVRYDEREATILDDEGTALDSRALALGTQIEILASAVTDSAGTLTATARSIRVASQLVGRIEASDLGLAQLRVLGQPVQITPDTYIDAALGGQAGLAIGDTVEVHAGLDAAGERYVATRIHRPASADRDKIVGLVSAFAGTTKTLVIGGLTIDGSGIDVPDAERILAPGRLVRATLARDPSTGVRRALSLRSAVPALDDRERAELEGRVTAFVSTASFAVNGVPVDAGGAEFVGGSAGLALGTKVEVKGSLRGGVLVAQRVQIEGDGAGTIELEGSIQSVDAPAQRFVLRGVTVSWDASTRFEKATAADIATGRRVKVEGRLSADGTRVEASLIHPED